MANEFIEIISEQTKRQINDIMPLVKELADQIKTINNFKPANTPSGADKNVQAMSAAYKEQSNALKLLKQELDNAANSHIKYNNQKISDIRLSEAQRKAALAQQQAEAKVTAETQRALVASERLNSAYNKLNKARTDAKNHLRDLIASEKASTAEINKAQKAFDILDQKVRKADKAVGDMSKNVGNYKSAFSGLSNLMGAFGIGTGLYLAVDVAKNIYETTKQLQSLNLALKMVSETSAIYASNTAFITQISEKWGIEIKGLTEQFTQFYVNAKGKLSDAKIKETFEGIAKAGSLMGISIDKQNDAFYAFNQMLSKGTVQAEELKKQLGNALPGAIKAATMAYQELHPELKVTEQMMLDQMKAGKLVSNEMVPAIIRAYQKLYGIEMVDKVDTLAAAQNRLANSWTDLVRSMNESEVGGISSFFKVIIGGLNNGLKLLTRFNDSWDTLNEKAGIKGKSLGAKAFNERMEKAGFGGSTETDKAKMVLETARKELLILKEQEKLKNREIANFNPYAINFGKSGKTLNEEKEQILLDIAARAEIIRLARIKLGLDKETVAVNTPEVVDKETKAVKENTKAKRDNVESVGTPIASRVEDTALERLKLLKAALEKTRDETSKTASEFKKWDEILEGVNGAIDQFTKPLTTDILPELTEKVKRMNDEAENTEQIAKNLKKALDETFNMFVGDFADRIGFTDTFDFMMLEKDGLTLFERLEKDKATWEDYALAITTIGQDMYNFLNQQSQARFEAEYARLEEQKNVALKFAGDSATAKEKIELDYEKKRKEIANREAKAKKQQAMFNIAIDTAQAIMSVIAKGGKVWEGVAVAAMGAIQLAMVEAQKTPQYWRGTDNAEAGLAWTQERGAEIVTDKHGHIKDFGSDKGAKLTMMEKGDKVYTAQQTKKMMFDDNLNSILTDNGIGNAPKVVVNNGMSKEDMKEIMMETVGSIPIHNTILRNGELLTFIKNGNSKTYYTNQRVSGKGLTL